MFFALKGENFNGNAFAAQALASGAAWAVVDDPSLAGDARMLLVPDVLTALQDLALHHRRQFMIPILAIGGSNGKTTTKELVHAVLCKQYPCHATKGNLNNHIGVPLTLLSMPAETEVAVVEMGANHAGDIQKLCQITEPTHGLLTNIGKEHLEGFGNLEGVKQAEGELFDYLREHKGWAFVNASEKYLKSMSRRNRRLLYCAANEPEPHDNIIEVQLVAHHPFVVAAFLDENDQKVSVNTQLVGWYNFYNVMTAIALGIYFKVPSAKIKAAIEGYTPRNNRSQILPRGSNTILLDAYNANPSSMEAALKMLKAFPAERKIAVLGDMLEVGADSLTEHQIILRMARRSGFQQIILVGPGFKACDDGKGKDVFLPDAGALRDWLAAHPIENTVLLFKGSRGIRLETALD
ncbi:MAG: UDP-N-acetylmuramoyl-tripeptide--D-alanyl-D-alanine ligase [Lewinellaceae bacterium]|nr:UDP-N-acetylmuramoyl-tripeptide--D-alanyl-D-alanine ligase [Lewinellaceae bacterium]